MKIVPLSIALVACLPVFAQDQPAITFRAFRTNTGVRVEGALRDKALSGTATSIQSDNLLHVATLKGKVEITVNDTRMQAEEVDLHWDSGEIEFRGNVRLMPSQQ